MADTCLSKAICTSLTFNEQSVKIGEFLFKLKSKYVWFGLIWLVLWYTNSCWVFNAKVSFFQAIE